MRHAAFASFVFAYACLAGQTAMAAQDDPATTSSPPQFADLGVVEQGEVLSLNLEAVNRNCEQPQDFRFDVSGVPWMHIAGSDTVPQLGPGESGSIEAIADSYGFEPGIYTGSIFVDCETCGWFVFAQCTIDRQQIDLQLEIVAPEEIALGPTGPAGNSGHPGPAGPPANAAGGANIAPTGLNYPPIPADPAAVPADINRHLNGQQRRNLNTTRRNAQTAANNYTQAVSRAEAARRARNDCEEELARLRAALATAQANAQTAAANLAAARASLAAYESDLESARRAMDRTYRELQAAAAYRTIIYEEDGTGSDRYREAQEQVDRFNDAAIEAQREFSRVRSSYEARQAAVTAAQAAAQTANAAAQAALQAVQAKERECLGLTTADTNAQNAVATAAAAANAANNAARNAANAAPGQAADNLRDSLRSKRQSLQRCHDAMREKARILTRAFRALRDLGVISGVSARDIDIEAHVAQSMAAVAADAAASAVRLPTFQVFTILDGLQAAYGIVRIHQLSLVPDTFGYDGDDNLANWLQDPRRNYADNPTEAQKVVHEMRRFVTRNGNTSYLREEWQRMVDNCNRLQTEIQEEEAELARLTR